MKAWSDEETEKLATAYSTEKDVTALAELFGKTNIQILRKLVSMKIYEKKERPIVAMNKDMLGREISNLLGIKLLTLGNMSRPELQKLLEHLEK